MKLLLFVSDLLFPNLLNLLILSKEGLEPEADSHLRMHQQDPDFWVNSPQNQGDYRRIL